MLRSSALSHLITTTTGLSLFERRMQLFQKIRAVDTNMAALKKTMLVAFSTPERQLVATGSWLEQPELYGRKAAKHVRTCWLLPAASSRHPTTHGGIIIMIQCLQATEGSGWACLAGAEFASRGMLGSADKWFACLLRRGT